MVIQFNQMHTFKIFKYLIIAVIALTLHACEGFKKVDQRQMPDGAKAKARKNIEEGRGVTIGGMIGRGGTNYEFNTSNPLWRASMETLDFLPMSTVDYSGGTIITDWYTDASSENKSIKITVRFLSNEITANSLKIIVHQKNCSTNNNCKVQLLSDSKIKSELNSVILQRAALMQKEDKNKKKKN